MYSNHRQGTIFQDERWNMTYWGTLRQYWVNVGPTSVTLPNVNQVLLQSCISRAAFSDLVRLSSLITGARQTRTASMLISGNSRMKRWDTARRRNHEPLNQCRFNVGPASATLRQHQTNIVSPSRVRLVMRGRLGLAPKSCHLRETRNFWQICPRPERKLTAVWWTAAPRKFFVWP